MWMFLVACSAETLPAVAARPSTSSLGSNTAKATAKAPSMPGSQTRMTFSLMAWTSFSPLPLGRGAGGEGPVAPLSPLGAGAGGEGPVAPLSPLGAGAGGEGRSHGNSDRGPRGAPASPPGLLCFGAFFFVEIAYNLGCGGV